MNCRFDGKLVSSLRWRSAGSNTLSFIGTRMSRTHTRHLPGKRLHSGLQSLDTIFTEKTQISDQWLRIRVRIGCTPVPEEWQIKNPQVTVLSSGLLTLGVLAAITNAIEVGQGMQFDLVPRDWDEERIAVFQRRHDSLGPTWETQLYDLRSWPFDLPNMVPDPYLESRLDDWSSYNVLENGFGMMKTIFHLKRRGSYVLVRLSACRRRILASRDGTTALL